MDETIVEMRSIVKEFYGVRVLDQVDFDLKKGEIHALIGENGAGKSTLMKILAGVYQKTTGTIHFRADDNTMKEISFREPLEALKNGISMVFQEFNLMNNMTIAENIFIGREPLRGGVVDQARMRRETKIWLDKVGLDLPPQTLVERLSTAQKQCVEIAKCLSYQAKIIILDEPTSSLSTREVERLFEIVRALKNEGVSIVFISHRIPEILEIADRTTVFRDGKLVGVVDNCDLDAEILVNMIVGRKFDLKISQQTRNHNCEPLLELERVYVAKYKKEVSFKVYPGEILGIFGLVGAGRTEMARVLFGVDPLQSGQIIKSGKKIRIRNPAQAIRNRIGLVPEDRKELGLITMLSVRENLVLTKLRELPFVLGWSHKTESQITRDNIARLSVVTQGENQMIARLSGGNQQKVAIAKWMALRLDVLIMDEPTRGVDIGAKAEIYEIMRQAVGEGMSIIMVSSDLEEILRASNRVLVMHEGEITLDAPTAELDEEKIMHAAIL